MHIKKNLAIAAAVAVLAVPALGATNHSHIALPSIHTMAVAHADSGYIPGHNASYESKIPKDLRSKYDYLPGVGLDQYNSKFNKDVHANLIKNENYNSNTKPKTTYINGHSVTVVSMFDIPGKITEIDGQPVTSKAQVLSMLSKPAINKSTNKSAQNATSNTNNVNNNNTAQNTNNGQENNNSKSGKLAQTGESNTGAKAGIVGAIAAMVSVAFAGVEKFFKRT